MILSRYTPALRVKGFSPCIFVAKNQPRTFKIMRHSKVECMSNQLRFRHTFASQKMKRKLLARDVSLDSLRITSVGGYHAQ